MRKNKTWEELWESFSDKYELDGIVELIENWIELSMCNHNICLYCHSINSKSNNIVPSQFSPESHVLDEILNFDFKEELFWEIEKSVSKLTAPEITDLKKIFLEKCFLGLTRKEDLIVRIAKYNTNYFFFEKIENEYLNLRNTYLNTIKTEIQKRRDEFENVLSSNPLFVHPTWHEGWYKGSGLASRHKTMFILATMHKDGYLSLHHLYVRLFQIAGGQKYFKFLKSL